MTVRFRFAFVFSQGVSLDNVPATLYRQTWFTVPGTTEPVMNFQQVAAGTVVNNRVDFNQSEVEGCFLRLGANTIVYRSDRLSDNDFTPVEGQAAIRELLVNLLDTGLMHTSVAEIAESLPPTPVFSVLKNTPQVKGVRLDSLQIKQVSQFLEVSGQGAALSFYDPNTAAFVELFPFSYVYRFQLAIFTGVPLSQRILNVESEQVVVTPKATGIGSNVMNALNGFILSSMNQQVLASTERAVQRTLDAAIQTKTGSMELRTVTLSGVEIVPEGGINYEGYAWLRPGGLGCRARAAQTLAQLARPAVLAQMIRGVLS